MARHSMRCTPRASSDGRICLFIARVTSRITSSHRSVPTIQPEPTPGQVGTKPPTATGSPSESARASHFGPGTPATNFAVASALPW